jgi:hypothetical protein
LIKKITNKLPKEDHAEAWRLLKLVERSRSEDDVRQSFLDFNAWCEQTEDREQFQISVNKYLLGTKEYKVIFKNLAGTWLEAYSSINRPSIGGLGSTDNLSESQIRNCVPVVGSKKIRLNQMFLRLVGTLQRTEGLLKSVDKEDYAIRPSDRSKNEAATLSKGRNLAYGKHNTLVCTCCLAYRVSSSNPDQTSTNYLTIMKPKKGGPPSCSCPSYKHSGKNCKHILSCYLVFFESIDAPLCPEAIHGEEDADKDSLPETEGPPQDQTISQSVKPTNAAVDTSSVPTLQKTPSSKTGKSKKHPKAVEHEKIESPGSSFDFCFFFIFIFYFYFLYFLF